VMYVRFRDPVPGQGKFQIKKSELSSVNVCYRINGSSVIFSPFMVSYLSSLDW